MTRMGPRFVRFSICLLLLHASAMSGAVRGIVFDSQGKAVAEARVTAHRWDTPAAQRTRLMTGAERKALATATTDEGGAFSLDPKVSGVVELAVDRQGFAPALQLALAGEENVLVDLVPAALRKGRVTAKGKAVSGVLVIAYLRTTAVIATRTGDDGTFAIPDPKGWCSSLVFVHPDYAPASLDEPSALDVNLDAGSTVTGSVSDSAGRPVPNATVYAGPWTTAKTGEDGTFVLHHAAGDEKKITALEGTSFGAASRDAKNTLIRIEPLGSIAGTVRDADQRPLEGVPVLTYVTSGAGPTPWRESHAAVSDAKGNYSIQHCEPGQYSVMAYGGSTLEFEANSVKMRDGRLARADLTATKLDSIAGTVLDKQKRPVAGATVQYTMSQFPLVYGGLAAQMQAASARSGRDGKFKIRKYEQLFASGMGVRLQAVHRDHAAGVSEPLQRDSASPVSIVLPAGIELTGIIKDSAGKPVASAGIALLQDPSGAIPMPVESLMSTGMLRPFAESDASGRFSVKVNAAPHDLGVWKEGYAGFKLSEFTPKAGDAPLEIVLENGAAIRGRVTSKMPAAVLKGTITALTEEGYFSAVAEVAGDGTFTIPALRSGPYTLNYSDEQGRTVRQQAQAPASDVVLQLPVTGELRGRVIDAATRETLRSYTVDFEDHLDVIDGEDQFVLYPEPATGELTVKADGYIPGKSQVTVQLGKPAEVTVTLTRGRSVAGVVTNDQGQAVAGAWVADTEYTAMEKTEAGGDFRLTGLPREALKLNVRADGYLAREIEVAAGETDIRLDVVLSRGRKVAGHVVSSDGAPVEGATVHARGDNMQTGTTDAVGAFVVEGLAEGAYTFMAKRDELQSEEVSIAGELPPDLVLVMKPSAGAGKIHGLVKGFSGGHWRMGMVRISPGEAFAMIGRDGRYTIERAPAGEVELKARAQSGNGDAAMAIGKVTVIAGGDVEANLVFREDIVIRGIVTDSGAPAPGRNVRFTSGEMTWSTMTGAEGRYQLTGVEPGNLYDVTVEGGQPAYTTRHLVTGSETFDIHIEWSRLEGRVIDGAGAPVPGAKVKAVTGEKRDAGDTATDAGGAFVLPVVRAPHVLTIAKDGFATFTQRVEAGAAPLLVKLVQSSGLRVRLTDARDGRTLDGYVVAVDAAGLHVARADAAQKDGTMLVPIADGAYRIAVSANGYASQSARASVPYQGELRFALTPGGTLIVRTDRPSADLVKLVLPNGEEYVRCQCNGIAEIRLTGTATTIEHVAPGNYTMHVLDERGLVKTSQPVTITEGQTTQTEIRVPE